MKKHIRSAILLVLLLGILVVTAYAVEPRYTGISRMTSTLTISETGAASCKGSTLVRSGYTADIKVELKQDGTTIQTWTNSGSSGTITAGGTRYVTSGHSYVVTTTVTVYNSNNQIIETPSTDSAKQSY